MGQGHKSEGIRSGAYIEWYTISIYWVIALGLILFGVAGYVVYKRWFKAPTIQQAQPIIETRRNIYALFKDIKGAVEVKPSSGYTYRKASFRLQLQKGDIVRTGSDGYAKIECPDNTVLEVPPDTLVRIECGKNINEKRIARLERGVVNVAISGRREQGNIETPNETTLELAKKSQAVIMFNEEQQVTVVELKKGEGAVQSRAGREYLKELQGAIVRQSGEIEKATLPDTPRVIQPRNRQSIQPQAGKVTAVTLEWSGVKNARKFEIQISSHPEMHRILRKFVPTTSVVVEIPNKHIDTWYYWRVRAIDENGLHGNFTPVQSFVITKQTIQAKATCKFRVNQYENFGHYIILHGNLTPTCSLKIGSDLVEIQPNGHFRYVYQIKKVGTTIEPVIVENLYGSQETWEMEVKVGESIGDPTIVRFHKKT